jgi:magnesium-transporting ATPase (P-type)
VIKMAEIPKNMRFLLFGRGARWMAWCGVVFAFLAGASFIVGIIGDVANKKPGLEPTNWFILMVAFFLLAFWSWLTAYFAAKEG